MTNPYPYSVEAAAHLRVVVALCCALGVPWTALSLDELFGGALPDFDDLLVMADAVAEDDARVGDRIEALNSWQEMRGYAVVAKQPDWQALLARFGGVEATQAFGLGVARVEVHAVGWRAVESAGEAAVALPITAPGPGGIRHCVDMLALRPGQPPVSRDGVTETGLVGADAAYALGPLPGPEIRLFASPQAWLADWACYQAERPNERPRPGSHAYLALGDLSAFDWECAFREVERVVCPERDFAEWLHAVLRRPRPKRHLPQLVAPKKKEARHADD